MKKFLIALSIILIGNLSCKKEQKLCGCSPVTQYRALNLVLKNSAGDDLLNVANTGAFDKNQIHLYYKEANGNEKTVSFNIRQPFKLDDNTTFNFYQLVSEEIVGLVRLGYGSFYLKLGTAIPYELKITLNTENFVERLLIDSKEAPKETAAKAYPMGNIFYVIK